jgi:hypothetical protein
MLQHAGVFLLLLFVSFASLAQDQKLHYDIHRHGKKVGDLNFQQKKAGAVTTYNIESEVKVKVLVSVVVKAKEASVYENDVMQSSSVVRHVNGRQKANKQIRNNGSGLTVVDEGSEQVLKNYRVKLIRTAFIILSPWVIAMFFRITIKSLSRL